MKSSENKNFPLIPNIEALLPTSFFVPVALFSIDCKSIETFAYILLLEAAASKLITNTKQVIKKNFWNIIKALLSTLLDSVSWFKSIITS